MVFGTRRILNVCGSWYVTCSTVGSAIGSEVAGRVVNYLQSSGWSLADAYHTLFWLYTTMGLINSGLTLLLTKECEMSNVEKSYAPLSQQEEDTAERVGGPIQSPAPPTTPREVPWHKRLRTGLIGRLSQISAPTLKVMYQLWLLLAVDSLADGMVSNGHTILL